LMCRMTRRARVPRLLEVEDAGGLKSLVELGGQSR
jgi:hypothetical protein